MTIVKAVSTKSSSPLAAVIIRYEAGDRRAANRYSNLLFVGITEIAVRLAKYRNRSCVHGHSLGVAFIVLVRQICRVIGVEWHILMDVFLGGLLAFITILGSTQSFSNSVLAFQYGNPFCPASLS